MNLWKSGPVAVTLISVVIRHKSSVFVAAPSIQKANGSFGFFVPGLWMDTNLLLGLQEVVLGLYALDDCQLPSVANSFGRIACSPQLTLARRDPLSLYILSSSTSSIITLVECSQFLWLLWSRRTKSTEVSNHILNKCLRSKLGIDDDVLVFQASLRR